MRIHPAALLLPSLLTFVTAHALHAGPPPVRVRTIDVRHIALDLRFDWARQSAIGRAAVTLAPLRAMSRITLDAGKLAIDSVNGPGGGRMQFTYDGSDRDDALAIDLGRSYQPSESLTVVISYRTTHRNPTDPNSLGGSNGKGLRFFGPTYTEPLKRRQVWSMGIPGGNRYWFPSYDGADDLRTTDIVITVPGPLTAIANGEAAPPIPNADGSRTFRYRMNRPYANALTSVAVGEYVEIAAQHDGIPYRSFGYPDEREAVAASVVRLTDMARFITERTGVRYPFPSYAQAFVQDMPWGVAAGGMSTMSENMVDDEPTHAEYFYLWDGLEAEGIAGQWFGSAISARDPRHVWLDRAFAHYFDALYSEQRNGRGDALLWTIRGDQNGYLGNWKGGTREGLVAPRGVVPDSFVVGGTTYNKGALVLHMLRSHLGDEVWWRVIREYTRANIGRQVTTEDFRRVAEEVSSQTLDWFFDQWVYGIGHPVFTVTTRYDAARREVELRVEQQGASDSTGVPTSDGYFQGPMSISLDDRVEQIWITPRAVNYFTFSAATPPRLIGFDREGAWIKELTFIKSLDDLLYQIRHDTDIVGVRWAIDQLVARAKSDSTSPADKARIHEGLRELIGGPSHWRLRIAAIALLTTLLDPTGTAKQLELGPELTRTLLGVIQRDSSWTKSAAVSLLGMSRDPVHVPLYLGLLHDRFHTVSYTAAGALGKTASPRAFGALAALNKVRSWKGENRLSALLGLRELGDPRGAALALAAIRDQSAPRWYLAVSRWDYRIAGVETLVALGRGREAYPIIAQRFQKAMAEDDVNDVFSNVLLLAMTGDPRGQALFDQLKIRFRDDANAMLAVNAYLEQFEAERTRLGATR